MKKINLIVILCLITLIANSANKTGSITINFKKDVKGYVVLKSFIEKNNKMVIGAIDSAKIINNKYTYSYKKTTKPSIVYITVYQKDSLPKNLSLLNPKIGKMRSGNIFLDNSSILITVDSTYSKLAKRFMLGTYSGSDYLDMNILLAIDKFIEHRFTNSGGQVVNFEIIKNHPKSLCLLDALSNSMGAYSTLDSVKMAFSMFDKSLRNTYQWNRVQNYILSQNQYKNSGIKEIFECNDIENNKFDFSKFIANKKFGLLIFWASWCAPCRAEIPLLNKLYHDVQTNVSFVSISLDKNKSEWIKAVKADNVNWLSLSCIDNKNKLGDIFEVKTIPFFIVVDHDGKILLRITGGSRAIEKLYELFGKN